MFVVQIEPADPRSAEAEALFETYIDEITDVFGYDSTRGVPSSVDDFIPPRGRLLVVRDEAGTAVGCGAVRLLPELANAAEIKRMWLHTSARGQGLGRALLSALEAAARELGADRAVLDTNASLTSALALYRNAGWAEVPAYNDNREATHWFAKPLAP